jgi:hypothetical protein
MGELAEQPEETFTHELVHLLIMSQAVDPRRRERREHRVFWVLLQMVPRLEEHLVEGSDEDIVHIAELICVNFRLVVVLMLSQSQKGASNARSDDTKSLKGAILDWITPWGQPLDPPLTHNTKIDHGFHHECTGALLCPAGLDWSDIEYVFSYAIHRFLTTSRTKEKLCSGEMAMSGDQWPIFLYHGYHYDPEDLWNGLFRSGVLLSVSFSQFYLLVPMLTVI